MIPVYITTSRGYYLGVEPGTINVYNDRQHGGEWEQVELKPIELGRFVAHFVAANQELSITPSGVLETRPAGTNGPWEQVRATNQPEGVSFLYRDGVAMVPLRLEAR